MIEFNKTMFENAFKSMTLLQDQAERMGSMVLDQTAWIPSEGKKAAKDWVTMCKSGRENFKKAVDDGFKKAESVLGES
jgi:glutamate/tyrosine decarboxylase-like PLP-dependent enzyme